MSKFTISTRYNGEFQFNLKETNGQVILISKGYPKKIRCIEDIAYLLNCESLPHKYEQFKAKNGKYYFAISKVPNTWSNYVFKIFAYSGMYISERDVHNAIDRVKLSLLDCKIFDTNQEEIILNYKCIKPWKRNSVGDVLSQWEFNKLPIGIKKNFKAIVEADAKIQVTTELQQPMILSQSIEVVPDVESVSTSNSSPTQNLFQKKKRQYPSVDGVANIDNLV